MQTVIHLKPSELTSEFIKKMKDFLKGKKHPKITITINDEEDYLEVLNRSVRDAETELNIISFNEEEFENYIK
jgi:ssRNA-specific RNase YbeY (16S rRNA maturation enzyme)